MRAWPLCLIASAICASDNPVVVDFRDACIGKEVIETGRGGTLENLDLWLQGEWMRYTHTKEANQIEGSGKLRLEYHGQLFVGERIEYDFRKRTGVIYSGKTHAGAFYIYGSKIYLLPDGRYSIEDGRLTMCESASPAWQIKAKSLTLSDDHLVQARDVIFKLARMPFFWLPSMRANLETLSKSPFEYQFVWKSNGGPRLTFKYQVFSWEHSTAHLRFDYRIRRGPGFGIETRYENPDKRMSFVSNSYIARDRKITNPKNKARYRLEGLFEHTSLRLGRYAAISYDKLSDSQMPYDYPRDTFELPSAKPTRLTTYTKLDPVTLSVIAQAKINRFETVGQMFPRFALDMLPLRVWKDNLMVVVPAEIAFLDYRFASRWKGELESYSTLRLYAHPELRLSFQPGPFLVSATARPTYLYYATGESERHTSVRFLQTSAEASLPLTRRWIRSGELKAHTLAPFCRVESTSEPTHSALTHDIYGFSDGYAELTTLDYGIKTALAQSHPCGTNFLESRLYAQNFWNVPAQKELAGRIAWDLSWQRPNLFAGLRAAYNRMYRGIEFTNGWIQWTPSDHFAINIELRHRSPVSWRKIDASRFDIDASYSIEELLASPLSDRRTAAISRLAWRFSPKWRMLFESRHSWNRIGERALNDFKIDVRHYLSCNLEIGFSISHTEANKIKGGISLNAGRFPFRPKLKVKKLKAL